MLTLIQFTTQSYGSNLIPLLLVARKLQIVIQYRRCWDSYRPNGQAPGDHQEVKIARMLNIAVIHTNPFAHEKLIVNIKYGPTKNQESE